MKSFITTYYPLAQAAGRNFSLQPLYILAQAAVESGWGTSLNSRKPNNNFFGIIATPSWKGRTRLASTGLRFRCYDTPQDSFNDFARLITHRYPIAASSATLAEYAHRIAQSPYISEANGDNRINYERMILSAGAHIRQELDEKV